VRERRLHGGNQAVRDALFPVAGWTRSLRSMALSSRSATRTCPWRQASLGTLAVLVFYYAVLCDVRLNPGVGRRIGCGCATSHQPMRPLVIPVIGASPGSCLRFAHQLCSLRCSLLLLATDRSNGRR